MASVQFENVRKVFGKTTALKDVDLLVRDGEFMVLLGPSGCGKTTLLRMIAGLEEPTSGDILIDGKVVTHLPPRARDIAMVFQSYALYPHLTVYKNIAFPLAAQGMAKDAIKEKVNWAAGMFGIERFKAKRATEVSPATVSAAPPRRSAITGVPQAIASTGAMPKSSTAANRNARARCRREITACAGRWPANSTFAVAAAFSLAYSSPAPMTSSRRPGMRAKASTRRSTRL